MTIGIKAGIRRSLRLESYARATVITAISIAQSAAGQVTVGANVQVSKSRAQWAQGENQLVSNPANAKQLLSAAMHFSPEKSDYSCTVYASFDGGLSWDPTLEADRGSLTGDPIVAYGPNGQAYAAFLAIAIRPDGADQTYTLVYRSMDAGKTWSKPLELPFFDREWFTVDNTGGKYNGRVYLHGNGAGHNRRYQDVETGGYDGGSLVVYHSTDGALSFPEPLRVAFRDNHMPLQGNGVVLSDGSFIALISEINKDPSRPFSEKLRIISSSNGGESISPAVTIGDWIPAMGPGQWGSPPTIAVDQSSGPFRDQMYVTWTDRRSGRTRVLLSYSGDKGRTWSKPRAVDDDPPAGSQPRAADAIQAVVAVNNRGVVGVMWFDRRDATNDFDWTARFAASLDGGETFSPSVKVSEAAYVHDLSKTHFADFFVSGGGSHDPSTRGGPLQIMVGPERSYGNGGDTEGLTADANAVFHAQWVDNRTGISQLWTAAVTAPGVAVPNGSDAMRDFVDVTASVALEVSDAVYDPASQTIKAQARIVNTSDHTLHGPLKVRVLSIEHKLGTFEIVDSDNSEHGEGALWDFSNELHDGVLKPASATTKRSISLRMVALGDRWRDAPLSIGGFGTFDAKVIARSITDGH